MKLWIALIFPIIALLSCSTTSETVIINYGQDTSKISIKKALIIPDLYPITTLNLSKMYFDNFQHIQGVLDINSIDVWDYQTSKSIAQNFELYTDLNNEKLKKISDSINVEIIIIPEYNVISSYRNALLWINNDFTTFSKLKIYSREKENYIAIVTSVGNDYYVQGLMITLGVAGGIAGNRIFNSQEFSYITLMIASSGLVVDFFNGIRTKGGNWNRAFRLSLNASIKKFLNAYQKK